MDTSDGWFIAPPMSSEETPPTPSPPDGEDSAPFLPPLPTKSSILRGPQFFLPEEKETAPAGACRRPTAAERRLLGRRQTGRARSTGRLLMALPFRAVASPLRGKEKKKYRPCGGDEGRGTRKACLRFLRKSFARGVVRAGVLVVDEWTSFSFRCR